MSLIIPLAPLTKSFVVHIFEIKLILAPTANYNLEVNFF